MATNYFAHCWGVFEGGGVRAAAHAGAFAAANAAGVTFGRVAGTSGGSIVAALVAAGANPEYLSEKLKGLDFSGLLTEPNSEQSVFNKLPKRWRIARRLTGGVPRKLLDLATFSGLHNADPLERWIEDRLQELIGARRKLGVKGPVSFSELSIPLHVVATDFVAGIPKVWSSEQTPQDSVAHAVRCSCSIPFFFQPIVHGSSLLVDGGVLSNLPAFVFSQLMGSMSARSVLSRILAFRLIEQPGQLQLPADLLEFCAGLAGASIDGATHIQSQLQQNVYSILIPTGTVRSTDFNGVDSKARNELYDAGKTAVRQFIANERLTVRSQVLSTPYQGFDEKMLLLVQELVSCERRFISVGPSTNWVDFVFPSLLSAARRGIQMTVITGHDNSHRERRQKWLLKELGADIVELNALPFEGFAFDLGEQRASAILGTATSGQAASTSYEHQQVRLYTGEVDPVLLQLLAEKVGQYWTPRSLTPRQLPYVECADTKLFERLRTIPMYANAKFRMTDVDVGDNILVIQKAVKEFKMLQIRNFMKDLERNRLDYFTLTEIDLPGGHGSIVTPPVLERVGDKFVVIEGNTRLFHCLASGVKKVRAVVIDDVQAALPATHPRPLSSLKLVSMTTTIGNLYSDVQKSLYRHIEEAVHPFPQP